MLWGHRRLVAQVLDLFAQNFEVQGDFVVLFVDTHDGADAQQFAR